MLRKIEFIQDRLIELRHLRENHPQKARFDHAIVRGLLRHKGDVDAQAEATEGKTYLNHDLVGNYHLEALFSDEEPEDLLHKEKVVELIAVWNELLHHLKTKNEEEQPLINRLRLAEELWRLELFNETCLNQIWQIPANHVEAIRHGLLNARSSGISRDPIEAREFFLTTFIDNPDKFEELSSGIGWLSFHKAKFAPNKEKILHCSKSISERLYDIHFFHSHEDQAEVAQIVWDSVFNFKPVNLKKGKVTIEKDEKAEDALLNCQVKTEYLKHAVELYQKIDSLFQQQISARSRINSSDSDEEESIADATTDSTLETLIEYANASTELTPKLNLTELLKLIKISLRIENPKNNSGLSKEDFLPIHQQAKQLNLLVNLFGETRAKYFFAVDNSRQRFSSAAYFAAFLFPEDSLKELANNLGKLDPESVIKSGWDGKQFPDKFIAELGPLELNILKQFFRPGNEAQFKCVAKALSWLVDLGLSNEESRNHILHHPDGYQLLDISFDKRSFRSFYELQQFATLLYNNLLPLIEEKQRLVTNKEEKSSPWESYQYNMENPQALRAISSRKLDEVQYCYLETGDYTGKGTRPTTNMYDSDDEEEASPVSNAINLYCGQTGQIKSTLPEEKDLCWFYGDSLSSRFLICKMTHGLQHSFPVFGFGRENYNSYCFKIWDVQENRYILSIDHRKQEDLVYFKLPDEKIAYIHQQKIHIFDAKTQQETFSYDRETHCVLEGFLNATPTGFYLKTDMGLAYLNLDPKKANMITDQTANIACSNGVDVLCFSEHQHHIRFNAISTAAETYFRFFKLTKYKDLNVHFLSETRQVLIRTGKPEKSHFLPDDLLVYSDASKLYVLDLRAEKPKAHVIIDHLHGDYDWRINGNKLITKDNKFIETQFEILDLRKFILTQEEKPKLSVANNASVLWNQTRRADEADTTTATSSPVMK